MDEDDVEMDDDLELNLTYPEVSPFVYQPLRFFSPLINAPQL